jgi:hypothetical protein
MVQAQRKLIERIAQYDGPALPQPHMLRAENEKQSAITPKIYTKLQLKVQLRDEDRSDINPGAQIDPVGHNAYSGAVTTLAYYLNSRLSSFRWSSCLAIVLCAIGHFLYLEHPAPSARPI